MAQWFSRKTKLVKVDGPLKGAASAPKLESQKGKLWRAEDAAKKENTFIPKTRFVIPTAAQVKPAESAPKPISRRESKREPPQPLPDRKEKDHSLLQKTSLKEEKKEIRTEYQEFLEYQAFLKWKSEFSRP